MKIILETPRLVLRELTPADVDFITSMLTHPQEMTFYPQAAWTRQDAKSWLQRQLVRYASVGHGLWLVLSLPDQPAGMVGLVNQLVEGVEEPEIGYLIHPAYWRQGYASEAACAVRDHAFGALGKTHVVSLIRPINRASIGVARKMGMRATKLTLFWGLEHIVWRVDRV